MENKFRFERGGIVLCTGKKCCHVLKAMGGDLYYLEDDGIGLVLTSEQVDLIPVVKKILDDSNIDTIGISGDSLDN